MARQAESAEVGGTGRRMRGGVGLREGLRCRKVLLCGRA